MIRIAVIDDNEIYAKKLHQDIENLFSEKDILFYVISYTEPEKFLLEHSKAPFDLIYLDIDMPKINGIELAAMVRKSKTDTYLAFVTSYNDFVYETFKYNTFRFIRREKLEYELSESIDSYCQEVCCKKEFIKLKFENNITDMENIRNMIYFYSLRHDIFVLCGDQSKRLANRSYTMDSLEELMKPYGFIRNHKTYLVNYRFVYQVRNDAVLLKYNGKNEALPLSTRRYSQVKEQYKLLIRGSDAL